MYIWSFINLQQITAHCKPLFLEVTNFSKAHVFVDIIPVGNQIHEEIIQM